MVRLAFIIPLLMFIAWWLYLRWNGWTIDQGMKGFKYILIFNVVIIAFYAFMIFITQQA